MIRCDSTESVAFAPHEVVGDSRATKRFVFYRKPSCDSARESPPSSGIERSFDDAGRIKAHQTCVPLYSLEKSNEFVRTARSRSAK